MYFARWLLLKEIGEKYQKKNLDKVKNDFFWGFSNVSRVIAVKNRNNLRISITVEKSHQLEKPVPTIKHIQGHAHS